MRDTTTETYYRPGLIFTSKYAGYQLILKEPVYHVFPDGQREMIKPLLVADFADGGTSQVLMSGESGVDDEGKPLEPVHVHGSADGYSFRASRADVRGGVFSLDDYVRKMGLDDDDREMVARIMVRRALDPRDADMQLWEPPVPTAPWPTYDDMHHFKIPDVAEASGLIAEALAYERATKNRPSVVSGLEDKLQDRETEDALTAA